MCYCVGFQDEEDSNEAKIDTLLQSVKYIVEKMKEQEALKFYEEEERKQQEWIQRNTSKSSQTATDDIKLQVML